MPCKQPSALCLVVPLDRASQLGFEFDPLATRQLCLQILKNPVLRPQTTLQAPAKPMLWARRR